MIKKGLELLFAVVILGLIAFFLDWAMTTFAVVQPFRNIVWLLFGLIILVGIVSLLGYGPYARTWNDEPPK